MHVVPVLAEGLDDDGHSLSEENEDDDNLSDVKGAIQGNFT